MATSQRKVFDCRTYPSDTHCSVTISGIEEEVLDEAVHHAMKKHGIKDNPQLREQLRTMLEDEK